MFSMPCSIVNNIKIRKMKNDRLKASEKKVGILADPLLFTN